MTKITRSRAEFIECVAKFPLVSMQLCEDLSETSDLLISYVKRKAKIKDTGKFLPGHGGILDRLDGIIFALPLGLLIYCYGKSLNSQDKIWFSTDGVISGILLTITSYLK